MDTFMDSAFHIDFRLPGYEKVMTLIEMIEMEYQVETKV
jgi:hypothetical protein